MNISCLLLIHVINMASSLIDYLLECVVRGLYLLSEVVRGTYIYICQRESTMMYFLYSIRV